MVVHFAIEPSRVVLGHRAAGDSRNGAMIGTPASMSARQPPQIEAIEVDPFEAMISETTRME